jgi:phage tail-like protein
MAHTASAVREGQPAFRFYVEVDKEWQAVFTELSGLGIEMAIEDVEEGGNNEFVHRLPGRCKVGTLTLKRGITVSNEFCKWSMDVARGIVTRKHVSVVMYDALGNVAMQWDFDNAYPIKWSGPQFKADDTAVAIETVELAHEGMKVQ